jgi:hypothetical protein
MSQSMIVTIKSTGVPRLRFDRTAIGFVTRLQKALTKSIPEGSTLIVTCTAPIRRDSKTSKELQAQLDLMLASGRKRLGSTIAGNRIQARVLQGHAQPGRLLGFIHNPEPGPEVLFSLSRAVLRSLDAGSLRPAGESLVIRNRNGRVPVQALQYICTALRAETVFHRVLVLEDGKSTPLKKAGRRGL